jgi:NitT/TauT family transport system substrate-binding protein
MNTNFWCHKKNVILVSMTLILVLSACTPKSVETNAIKFAVLPIIDSLPMYVAQQEGLFEDHNIKVELITVGSGPERDQLLASKQTDGVINEVLTTIMNNREIGNIQIVRFARAATSDTALFSILASAQSGITTVDGLKGQKIGISEGTVIEYLTDRMLQMEGLTPDQIVTVAVPKIPDRMTLLGSGELTAATMPEPVSSLLALQGATVVLADSKYPEISHSAIAFRTEFIKQNPETVRSFLAAIEEAIQKINADPAIYETTLVENQILPQPLVGKFKVPQFVTAGVPTDKQYQDVLAWAHAKGMLTEEVPYERCITAEYLPVK